MAFTDLFQPPWTKDKDTKPLDVGGNQKFKIQSLRPGEGWFEVTGIKRAADK